MAFTFCMAYKPDYQRRRGECAICHQGILAGDEVMVGTGYFNGQLVRSRSHYKCWIETVPVRARQWFFEHDFVPKAMAPEKKAELNRLRAKRYYIRKKGGEPNAVTNELAELEKQIAIVKAR